MLKVYIDTGGTFTDCIAEFPNGETVYNKVLSNGSLRGKIIKKFEENKLFILESWNTKKDIFVGYDFRISGINKIDGYKITEYDVQNNILSLNKKLPHGNSLENHSFEITANEEAPVLGILLMTETGLHEPFPEMQVRLGSTKGTNALLEKKGAKTALLVTKGFKDLIRIGNQQRPDIFAKQIKKATPLTEYIYEVEERIDKNGKKFVI